MEREKLSISDADVQAMLAEQDRLEGNGNVEILEKQEWYLAMCKYDPVTAKEIIEAIELYDDGFTTALSNVMPYSEAKNNSSVIVADLFRFFCVALSPIYHAYGLFPKIKRRDIQMFQAGKVLPNASKESFGKCWVETAEKSLEYVRETIKLSNALWSNVFESIVTRFLDRESLGLFSMTLVLVLRASSYLLPMDNGELAQWFDKQVDPGKGGGKYVGNG